MKRVIWVRLFIVTLFKLNGRKMTRFLICSTLLVYLEQGSPQVKKTSSCPESQLISRAEIFSRSAHQACLSLTIPHIISIIGD
jgi:hypothetical protein